MASKSSVHNTELLRRHGMQVTAQRLAVLRAVSDRPHRTADDIYNIVRAEIGAISRQAVYDALGTLTDRGDLARAHLGGPAPMRRVRQSRGSMTSSCAGEEVGNEHLPVTGVLVTTRGRLRSYNR